MPVRRQPRCTALENAGRRERAVCHGECEIGSVLEVFVVADLEDAFDPRRPGAAEARHVRLESGGRDAGCRRDRSHRSVRIDKRNPDDLGRKRAVSAVVRRESAHIDRPGLFGQGEGPRSKADHAVFYRVRAREVVFAEAPHDCHVRILVARPGLGVVSAPRDAEGNVALVVRIVVDGRLKRDDRLRDRGRVALRSVADDDDAIAAVSALFVADLVARAAATAAAKPVDAIPGQFNRTGSRLATARPAAA